MKKTGKNTGVNILVSIEDWGVEWPGTVVEWEVRWGMVDQPLYPEVHAWVIDPATRVTAHSLEMLPKLEVIVTASTGTDHIDLKACENVKVLSLLDDREGLNEIKASSEGTFMLLLMTLKNVKPALENVRSWWKHKDLFRGNELYGKTVGIIGLGRIGQNIYKWCKAFGAECYTTDIADYKLRLSFIFKHSDIVVVCCTLNDESRGMINKPLLESMKQNAVLVNTSRGEVINETDLVEVLLKRPDLRVGLDVMASEVSGTHLRSPLFKMKNVIITPHISGLCYESNKKAAEISAGLLRRYEKET